MRLITKLRALVASVEQYADTRPPSRVAAFRAIADVLAAPCATHAVDAVCDHCPAQYETDGRGFPHRGVIPKGCTPLRHCPGCGRAVPVEQWQRSGVCTPCAQRIADELASSR